MNQKTTLLRVFAMLFILLNISVSTFAQGLSTSAIAGVVTDDKKESLPGATVVAVHLPSGTKYGAVTNISGKYTFPAPVKLPSLTSNGAIFTEICSIASNEIG